MTQQKQTPVETLEKQRRLLLLALIAYVNDPSLLRTARAVSQCGRAKKTRRAEKKRVSEREKKRQQDSG